MTQTTSQVEAAVSRVMKVAQVGGGLTRLEAAIRELLAELAASEAEIANSALNYVSLFGELQNALDEIARLRDALSGIANADQSEWDSSLRNPYSFKVWSQSVSRAALTKQPPKD